MLKVKGLSFDELSDEEKEIVSNNGSGKEYAGYIKVLHDGETICLHSDAMEPEDASFCRDLSWISGLLDRCYNIGKQDA